MGSGSTGVAASNTGRNFIGIERDNKYYEIALNRIKNCQGEINEIKQSNTEIIKKSIF